MTARMLAGVSGAVSLNPNKLLKFSEHTICCVRRFHSKVARPARFCAMRRRVSLFLTSRVRWTESVQVMRGQGIETFIEVGPKDVLTKLLRHIDRKAKGIALSHAEALSAFVAEQGEA